MNLLMLISYVFGEQTASLKYFDSQGNEIAYPLENRNFIAFFVHKSLKLYLRSSEHQYFTHLHVFEDPCETRISGLFNSAKGIYNSCSKKLEFVYMNSFYSMDTSSKENNIEVLPLIAAPTRLKEKIFNERDSQSDSLEIGNKTTGTDNFDENGLYRMKVFVFNSENRVKRLGKDILNNTNQLFDQVNKIFSQSKIPLTIEVSGILNFSNEENLIKEQKPILETFKDLIEPTRFSRINYKKPMGRADLTLLIYEKRNKTYLNGNLTVHGMTYMGGSSRLDSSYSTVITSPNDSKYFIAKKLAHEIGHSLNALHTLDESIMEKTTCLKCEDQTRLFSEQSKNQIIKFLNRNSRVFNKKFQKKHQDDEILKTKIDATEYAVERRKHSFYDIVKTRLHNRKPNTAIDGPNPFFILFLYSLLLVLVFYYWK